jgi:transcriptional regulator with XRE-family HTH domain
VAAVLVAWDRGPPVTPRSPEHAALGRAIRELRAGVELSQEGLADRAGLHRTYVGGIERGERNVSYGNLLRIAAALGVRPSQLLARAEGPPSPGDHLAGS